MYSKGSDFHPQAVTRLLSQSKDVELNYGLPEREHGCGGEKCAYNELHVFLTEQHSAINGIQPERSSQGSAGEIEMALSLSALLPRGVLLWLGARHSL